MLVGPYVVRALLNRSRWPRAGSNITGFTANNPLVCQVGERNTAEEELPQADADGAPFNWVKQWYPLAVEEDLDRGRPHAELLLSARRPARAAYH